MIVYNLSCDQGHGFEAWFKDAKAFASQKRARKLACPVCGATGITRIPAAPRISSGSRSAGPEVPAEMQQAAEVYRRLSTLHRKVRNSCEDVGDRFAEEARKIHYGETEARGIYGEATMDEAQSLAEEGVPFAALPKLPEPDA